MKRLQLLFCLTIIMFSFSGCAMLLKNAKAELSDSEPYLRNININSEPIGAKVYINGNVVGFTPLKTKLDPHFEYNINFTKDGYDKASFMLKNRIGVGWFLLDAAFGFSPMLFDGPTGDWKEFKQKKINIILEKQ